MRVRWRRGLRAVAEIRWTGEKKEEALLCCSLSSFVVGNGAVVARKEKPLGETAVVVVGWGDKRNLSIGWDVGILRPKIFTLC